MANNAQVNSDFDEDPESNRVENYDSDATDMSGEIFGDDDQEEQLSPRIQVRRFNMRSPVLQRSQENRPNLSWQTAQQGHDAPIIASSPESAARDADIESDVDVSEGSSTHQQIDPAHRDEEELLAESEPEDMQVEDQVEVIVERPIENQIDVDEERQAEDNQVEVVNERQGENEVVVIQERQADDNVEVVREVEVVEVELEEEPEAERDMQLEEPREANGTERAEVDVAVISEVQTPAVVEHPKQETPKKEAPKSVAPASPDSEDDEGQTCPICFEPWSNSGSHRLSSLKCGHIFGQACIERWLKGQGGKCPQCNAKATKKDVRVLYAKSLKVIDTSERDRVLHDLEKEREARRKLELEHAQTKLKYELKAQLVVKLQNELLALRQSSAVSSVMDLSQSQGSESKKGRLVLCTSMELQKDGGCRVMAFNSWLNMLVVSVPSQVQMFSGFGVKKVNMLDMKAERYVPIHQKQIRDMAFNPAKNDLLLTVGIDKVAKLTNVCSNANVQTFTTEAPLWACCWDSDEPNVFYVGTSIGTVVKFDTRLTTGSVETLYVSGSGPIVSLCFVPQSSESTFPMTGLLVARLQSCSFMEVKEDGTTRDHTLPLEGPFTSVSFENSSRHFLVSCRPSQKFPHARHMLCSMSIVNIATEPQISNNIVSSNIVHTFKGGTTQKVLSRSCLLRRGGGANPNGSVVACASDESNQSTYVWDTSTGNCVQQLKGTDTVIDILSVNTTCGAYLSLLSDKILKVFKWVDVLS
ncbi:E3 ubiquitin-protein ligase rfwd3.L-like isoform X2 [Oratosquilla oratoria]|uniref:E3 ubiquitin-protein ligase rfwd3.L-like isoform X2 n=1 Tax=Oratosquilla oratoria TaxID=337810 RepID=UPI003F76065A